MNKARLLAAPLIALIKLHWIALCIVVGAVVLYTLAGFFLVPYVARTQIEKYVTQTLHRKVSIGEIRFNPFALDLSVSRFELKEANDAPLISFRHLYVNAQLASLWQRGAVLREVQWVAPDIDLVIEKDGAVNLARLAPVDVPSSTQEDTPPPRVRIGTLTVTEGRVDFSDYTHTRPFIAGIAPIRFTLNDFKTDVGYANAYDFSGTTTSGEQLEWSGDFAVRPLRSQGRFRVEGLKAATIDSYIYETLPFQLASGSAALSGTYRFALQPQFALDFTLPTVQVRDLVLTERKAGVTAPVTIPAIDVHDVAFSFAARDVGVKRIDIRNAKVDVAIEADGSISLMRLIEGSQPTQPPDTNATQPSVVSSEQSPEARAQQPHDWRFHIDAVQFTDSSVVAEDRSISPMTRFELTPVQLTVNGWNTDSAAKLQVDVDVTINKEGRLLSKGELQLEPLSTRLVVDLTSFDLPVIQPYLEKATAMTLHSGKLSAKGDLAYAATPEAAPPLAFKGEVVVADLRTTDQFVNEDFVKWRNLAITGIAYSQFPDRLSIDRVVAREPYAKVVIAKDTSLNVSKVLRIESEADAAGEAEEPSRRRGSDSAAGKKAVAAASDQRPVPSAQQSAMPVRIKSVQFIDGSANFADYSIEPSFATGILGLNGTVTGLSSDPASRATVKLDGKVDKYAPVDISGTVNLLAAAKYTDLALNFRNMELTTFNPYSGKFAGYNISKGKLSTELHYKVEDRKLDAAHHIVVDNLEFGAKTDSKDAAPIPLKLAVALLKDRNGVIDVSLPVTGTLDDPKFRLGPIIWKAILGLLTKIVTAPFAALGALFGGGDEMAYVDFAPGTAVLSPGETEKLNKLAKALIERPQLKLNVPLTVVAAQDSAALAQATLAKTVPATAESELADDRAKRQRVAQLEKAYKELVKTAPEYPPETKTEKGFDLGAQIQFLERSLLERAQPDDAALTALAHERARAVQDALLANTELNPERVFITAERTEGKAEGSVVRMEMKLE